MENGGVGNNESDGGGNSEADGVVHERRYFGLFLLYRGVVTNYGNAVSKRPIFLDFIWAAF